MKISEMIDELQKQQEKHGDINVKVAEGGDYPHESDPMVCVEETWTDLDANLTAIVQEEKVVVIY